MKLAFCLFKYFPYSGLSRDFIRILKECQNRNHDIYVYASEWQGDKPEGVKIKLLSTLRLMNHAQNAAFYHNLQNELKQQNFDAVIGFNKMPGLDIYYGADYCYVGRAKPRYGPLYRLTPRYHHFFTYERAVFSPQSTTGILALSEREKTVYQHFYGTPDKRFLLLPPTLDKNRRRPKNVAETREKIRAQLGIPKQAKLLLFIGSGFKTKGLDRAIYALSSLPTTMRERTYLNVVGQDNIIPFTRIAQRCGVSNSVRFLGGRSDIPDLMVAGDLLIHPAYSENTGTVLLEAITSGLPVLTTDVCGYAPHIEHANAGVVLPSPFGQNELNQQLNSMLSSAKTKQWSENGIAYGRDPGLYQMPESAVDKVEQWVAHQQETDYRPTIQTAQAASLYLRDDLKRILAGNDDFDRIMSLSGEVFREAPGRRTIRLKHNGRSYFLKSHTGVGWQEIFKNLSYFRMPVLGAMNEWHGVHHLQRLGIDTLTIAGYGTTAGNPARRRSFILTDELANTVSLEDFCGVWKKRPPRTAAEIRFKRWLIKRVAEIARDIHGSGANHRDFYLCHFLLEVDDKNSTPTPDNSRLYLIDLHRMQIRRKTPVRWAVKDISGLYYSSMDLGFTTRDLYRFMRVYRNNALRHILAPEAHFWRRVGWRARNLYKSERRRAQRRADLKAPNTAPTV